MPNFIMVIVDSALFWGVITLILAAMAFSGKLSANVSVVLLVVAWILSFFGIYRSDFIHNWYLIVATWLGFGSALTLLAAWMLPPLTIKVAPPSVGAMAGDVVYPSGMIIGGIPWSPRFTDLRIWIFNGTDSDYTDIDLVIKPDKPIAAIAQITKLHNVSISPAKDIAMRQELIEGAAGKRFLNPLVLIASTDGYRVRMPVLPKQTRVEIVAAIAEIKDFPTKPKPPQPDFGIFTRDYVLRLDFTDGTVHWFGHGKDKSTGNRIDDVYKPERPRPQIVQVDGQYRVGYRERKISERVTVRDLIGQALPIIRKKQKK